MRQIDLAPYKIQTGEVEKDEQTGKPKLNADGKPVLKSDDFNVRMSLGNILFHDGVGAREAIVREKLASQIEAWPDEVLLIEEADWKKLEGAIDHLPQVARGHVEFVRRVIEAPTVEVQPKAPPASD
jgi:hypothetical protein